MSLGRSGADDDVYDYICWRLKLEEETENIGVCTKERKGVSAEVLMARHEGGEGRCTGAVFAGSSPPFLGREGAAVDGDVGTERRSPRDDTGLALEDSFFVMMMFFCNLFARLSEKNKKK